MPDLVLSLNRDGTIVSHGGGRAVPMLTPKQPCCGQSLSSVWPLAAATTVMHLVRKAISSRTTQEIGFLGSGQGYWARVSAEGPARALCVIRVESGGRRVDDSNAPGNGDEAVAYPDRREFMMQCQKTLSLSLLTEKPMAVIVMRLDGIEAIAQIDAKSADRAIITITFTA